MVRMKSREELKAQIEILEWVKMRVTQCNWEDLTIDKKIKELQARLKQLKDKS